MTKKLVDIEHEIITTLQMGAKALKALDMRIKLLEENFKILENRVEDLEESVGRLKRI